MRRLRGLLLLEWHAAAARSALVALLASGCGPGADLLPHPDWPAGAWPRHTIDNSSLGADGVRLADINGDDLLDIASPWEQGGLVRVYLNPGPMELRTSWPAVTVGEVGDPEDAFFVDLDGDGRLDVVSACEGSTRTIYVHWAPADPARLLDPDAWVTEPIPASVGITQWMFGVGLQVDARHGTDLIAGSKGPDGRIGWFAAPTDPRDLARWVWHPLYKAGWVMTIRLHDMDSDGDADIVATDRTGPSRGALWLENPGPGQPAHDAWSEHRIGPAGDHEAMHNAVSDLDGDGREDVLVAVKGGPIQFHRRNEDRPPSWDTHSIAMPPGAGSGKSVEVADVDLDGKMDLVVACEHATEGKIGVFWLSYGEAATEPNWTPRSVSGPEGFIYDLIQLTDLDGDGDLDVVTLEEKGPYLAAGHQGAELGVIWYENPVR